MSGKAVVSGVPKELSEIHGAVDDAHYLTRGRIEGDDVLGGLGDGEEKEPPRSDVGSTVSRNAAVGNPFHAVVKNFIDPAGDIRTGVFFVFNQAGQDSSEIERRSPGK
jgi:hypothetical protein